MYNLKIIKCGDRIEIYKTYNYAIKDKGSKEEFYRFVDNPKVEKEKKLSDNTEKKTSEENRIDTLNKARNNITRLIKCNNDMTTFITLTFSVESDYKESKKYLNTLFNKLRNDYSNLKYLWVLEYGDLNKRLHYHLLCNIPINIKLSTSKEFKSVDHKKLENDFRNKYWNYGWVDIRSLSQEGNTNIALYVSSYIVKSMQDVNLEGYRIYGYSHKTLDKPIIEKSVSHDSIEKILLEYKDKGYKIKFSNSYPVGYSAKGEEHRGFTNYFDLEKMEDIDNGN